MFGVDIAGNQPGDILGKIPFDFAIVKATGNPNTNGYAWNYVNPKMKQQADEALAKTGCLGLYCFAWGKDAIQEADFFVDTIKDYIGKAIPFLDYEAPFSNQNRREWCRTFVRRVKERTGSTVGIYASSSVINAQNLVGLAQEENCLLWSANYYLGYKVISGYSTSGMKMAIPGSDLWQFTSSGRLSGYNGNLDLDEAYMTKGQWQAHAAGTGVNLSRFVQMYTPNGTDAQKFAVKWNEGRTHVMLTNLRFGIALDVQSAINANGTPVWAYTPNESDAQMWSVVPFDGDYYPESARPVYLVPKCAPDKCLDVSGGSTENGARLNIYERNGTPAQQWLIADNGDGTWSLINNGNGNKLAIDLPW